ncbi:MAG: 2-dehydropantoate 2-reductase [Geminicoccaceae bacterium]|nr:MAG: 2-dehydropantoate 2-reductase [Geminicoccaceae bacterium]
MMRIAFVGAGGVGGWFGARLAHAGADVAFVARGAHAEAMRSRGLELRGEGGPLLQPVRLAEAGDAPYDVVLLATKMYDLDAAIEAAKPFVGPSTRVVPLQNGVEAHAITKATFGDRTAGGVAGISAHIEEPGVIVRAGPFAWLKFGEWDGRPQPLFDALMAACAKAKFEAEHSPRIELAVWNKFVMLAPFATICGYARQPIGPIRDDAALWARLEALVREACAVGLAHGIPLDADRTDQVLEGQRRQEPSIKASMLKDLEAGRRIELDWLGGAVERLGAEAGVPTPITTETVAAIRAAYP